MEKRKSIHPHKPQPLLHCSRGQPHVRCSLRHQHALGRPMTNAWLTRAQRRSSAEVMHVGETVPLMFTPRYAPPEVALATERGDRSIAAEAAADMWALGVMAFELLTNEPVFTPLAATRESIWAQLCGREVLPWERGAPKREVKLAQLRMLKRAILQCLQRDPANRPTASKVLAHWRELFECEVAASQPL